MHICVVSFVSKSYEPILVIVYKVTVEVVIPDSLFVRLSVINELKAQFQFHALLLFVNLSSLIFFDCNNHSKKLNFILDTIRICPVWHFG